MRAGVASALCVGFAQDMAPSANATALMTEHLACECMVADIYAVFILVIVSVLIYTVCMELYCMQRVYKLYLIIYLFSYILHVSVLNLTAFIKLYITILQ